MSVNGNQITKKIFLDTYERDKNYTKEVCWKNLYNQLAPVLIFICFQYLDASSFFKEEIHCLVPGYCNFICAHAHAHAHKRFSTINCHWQRPLPISMPHIFHLVQYFFLTSSTYSISHTFRIGTRILLCREPLIELTSDIHNVKCEFHLEYCDNNFRIKEIVL
jgi:hypothetical protein